MFKGKQIRVIISQDAKKELDKLNKNQLLINSIKQKVKLLKQDPEYGIHISKNKIPKEYKTNYEISNLWKINLSGAWRMLYTIRGNKIEIIALILDFLSHKDYEKKMKYKKS